MVQDINKRLTEFGLKSISNYSDMILSDLKAHAEERFLLPGTFFIKHLGLNKQQIKRYNPPPNPAKVTDPRAGKYIDEHGPISWEVDALEPKVLINLLEKSITALINVDQYNEMVSLEEKDKELLNELIEQVQ